MPSSSIKGSIVSSSVMYTSKSKQRLDHLVILVQGIVEELGNFLINFQINSRIQIMTISQTSMQISNILVKSGIINSNIASNIAKIIMINTVDKQQ